MEPPTTDAGPWPSVPPGGQPRPRQLRRRPDEGHIAGVCAGVAHYFNVDPVIVRIAAVVLAFTGPGFFAYILAWIFVPEATGFERFAPQGPIDRKDRGTQIFGIVLLALAASLLWGDWWSPAHRWLLPLGFIALGGWLLLRGDHVDDHPTRPVPPGPGDPSAPPWAWTPTATGGTDSAPTDPTTVFDDPTTTLTDVDAGGGDGGTGMTPPPRAPWDVPIPPVPPEPPASSRRRRMLGPIVFGALLIWAGIAALTGVAAQTGLAVGLCMIGVGFVFGAFVGGSRGLIFPVFLVALALLATTVVDIPLHGPIGDQHWAPQRVSDVEDLYEVSLGEGTLDLSAIDVDPGDELDIEVRVGLGHLVVLVPDDLAVDTTSEVGAGEVQVLGHGQNGVGISTSQFTDAGVTGGTVVLDLQVGLGQIEVRHVDPDRPTTTTTSVLG